MKTKEKIEIENTCDFRLAKVEHKVNTLYWLILSILGISIKNSFLPDVKIPINNIDLNFITNFLTNIF